MEELWVIVAKIELKWGAKKKYIYICSKGDGIEAQRLVEKNHFLIETLI